MRLHLKFSLIPEMQNTKPINWSIYRKDQIEPQIPITSNTPVEIEIETTTDYHNLPDSIPVVRFESFASSGGQKIKVDSVQINGQTVEDRQFRFEIKNTAWHPDSRLDNCQEIQFNGDLEWVLGPNRDKLCWFPVYHSQQRNDFTFHNALFYPEGLEPPLIPWMQDVRSDYFKKMVYTNQPHLPYNTNQVYPIATFGCSCTYGEGNYRSEIWPSLISNNTLNLAVPGLGWDGCWVNIQAALRKFQIERIVIVLPNIQRRLLRMRLPMTGGWARFPVTTSTATWFHTSFCGWAWREAGYLHDPAVVKDWRKKWERCAYEMIYKDAEPRAKKIIRGMQRTLNKAGIPYWISSWCHEGYEVLKQEVPPKHLLPFFKQVDVAHDISHPGPRSHSEWLEKVKPIVGL
jgi:hypothetical protein